MFGTRPPGVELVGEADVVDLSKPPPQGDGLGVALAPAVAGQGIEGGHTGARGPQLQPSIAVLGTTLRLSAIWAVSRGIDGDAPDADRSSRSHFGDAERTS